MARVTDLDAADIAADFRTFGAVLFRGFLPDESAFEALTAVFSADFLVDSGVTRLPVPHREPPTRQIRTPRPEHPFGLHAELSTSAARRPHILWLYCVTPAESGGETILCDGAAVYARLSPQARAVFSLSARVQHTNRRPVSPLARASYASTPAFANALVGRPSYAALCRSVTMANGAPIPRLAWEEAKAVADTLTVAVRWRRGDLLMIDNHRCMHGRRPLPASDPRTLYSRVAWDLRSEHC
ncbi:MAG: TauD/TfdA family dioxygenase [Myxococcota bacterium]|nr:TauD/TfdA family dioxygenase [Myxococcota bacterium]